MRGDHKEYSGCLPSPNMSSSPIYRRSSPGLEVNLNKEKEVFCIGKSSVASARKLLWPSVDNSSDHSMQSCPDQSVPPPMSGRKKAGSREPSSSSESNHSDATPKKTGRMSGGVLFQAESWISRQTFEFVVITRSDVLAQTMVDQLEWNEHVMCSTGLLELVRVAELGKKPEWKLTLRIHGPNFGAATKVKEMLYSMNLEVVSTSRTCSDGQIVTRLLWTSKDQACLFRRPRFG